MEQGLLAGIQGFNPADFAVSDEERKKLLLGNLLLGLGAGAFNANKGNWLGAAGSGAIQGMQLGQQALSQAQAAKLDKLKAASGFMDLTQKKQAYMDDQAYREAAAKYQPSDPQQGASPPSEYERVKQRIRYLEASNVPQKYIDAEYAKLEKLAPKYKGMETVMGPDGKPTLLQTYENQAPTPMQGFQPKPDITMQDFGGSIGAIDKLRVQNGQMFGKTATPGEVLSNEVARGNLDVNRGQLQVSRDRLAMEAGNQGNSKASELRKEFNALPQVKAYGEVQPVLQSAREAAKTNTAAADLNLIYAAAKIMDPGSVVRESETSMVVKAGSPAERLKGQFSYIVGGGRLTPEARAQLMTQIESRAGGFEAGYQNARKVYEGVASKNNIPGDQVFIEPFATANQQSAPKPQQGGLTPAEAAELAALKKKYNR